MPRKLWLMAALPIAGVLAYRRVGNDAIRRFAENYHTYSMPTAQIYDAVWSRLIGGFYSSVARELATICPSGTILEIGSGPGRLAVEMALAAPALKVTGLDIMPDMVDMASRRTVEADVSGRAIFQVGDVTAMPFADAQFDLAVSSFSMHHWPEPERGLAEIQRVLKPGGAGYVYDLSGWILDLFHESKAMKLPAASRFLGTGEVDSVWGVGPVEFVQRLRWRR